MRRLAFASIITLFAAAFTGCGDDGGPETPAADASPEQCDPALDDDGDCLGNGLEGCGAMPDTDSDGDGMPDWFDADADDDDLPDSFEAGTCDSPRDADGDGQPDFQDEDSDNDGVTDGFEDRDGNGVIGDCTTECSDDAGCDAELDESCAVPMDGDGSGVCVSPACSNGETSPYSADTDGDGTKDDDEGTFICHPQSNENPWGLKRIRYVDSTDTSYTQADWRIAIEVGALDEEVSILGATAFESAYLFDMTAPGVEVAGFLVTRASIGDSAVSERNWAIEAIQATDTIATATIRVSGTNQVSLDGFDTVLGTRLIARSGPGANVTSVRAELLPALLNRPAVAVDVPDLPWSGNLDQSYVIVYQTVYRGNGQTVFMGAVARQSDYEDRAKPSGFFADDLSNGTGLSVSNNGEALECEQYLADQQAMADIIWLVDESGSTSGYRDSIVQNADAFFQKAVDVGLDFRMGVTDLNDTGPGGQPGIFATRDATSSTGDRRILPSEPDVFSVAVEDPSGPDSADGGEEHGLTQGRSAIVRHTPRDDANPAMVRGQAKLVVIYVTDEHPDELEEAVPNIIDEGDDDPLTATQLQQVLDFLVSYIADFTAEDGVAHLVGIPQGGSPDCDSLSEPSDGYYQLVDALGGQQGSICSPDLGPTIDAIIDSIIGDASPIVLSKVPISASIGVARDGVIVRRSRTLGWDFRSASNSVIFFNMPFDPANPADIVVSYRRWAEQVPIN